MLKKWIQIPALFLALFVLSGNASCTWRDGVDLLSAVSAVQEPSSINTQYEAEAVVYVIRRPVVEYFRLRQCRASETASLINPCARRSVKVRFQDANRRVNVALLRFRADPTALTAIRAAVAEYKLIVDANRATITAVGVQ